MLIGSVNIRQFNRISLSQTDLETKIFRVVPRNRAEEMAREFHVPYAETSARTGVNVQEVFLLLARIIFDKRQKQRDTIENIRYTK